MHVVACAVIELQKVINIEVDSVYSIIVILFWNCWQDVYTIDIMCIIIATVEVTVAYNTCRTCPFRYGEFLYLKHTVRKQCCVPVCWIYDIDIYTCILAHGKEVVALHVTVKDMILDKTLQRVD